MNLRGALRRLDGAPHWTSDRFIGGSAWQSNGGPSRRHPARALPFSIEVRTPESPGGLVSVGLVGLFALHADPADEPSGAIGASVSFFRGQNLVHRLDLIQGRHYGDCRVEASVYRPNGDGTLLESIGMAAVDSLPARVDLLTIELPKGPKPDRMVFSDQGTPASFCIFDVVFEFAEVRACPFSNRGPSVGLGDIGAAMRLRDWPRFESSLQAIEEAIRSISDLDEAKGLGLTFLSAIVGALLETDAPRSMHQFLLVAARSLDGLESVDEVAECTVGLTGELTRDVFPMDSAPEASIQRALAYLERHYAEEVSDAQVAARCGLSTSHFRFLFRQATRQPFQKYLLSLRLEKSREMLLQTDLGVQEIGERTGFTSAAHFSRVFHQRFGASPSAMRLGRKPEA